MVRDDEGHWWVKLGESGVWHYRADGNWIQSTPPAYEEDAYEPLDNSSPAQTPPSLHPNKGTQNGENGGQKVPPWILVAGVGGLALVGIVVIGWVLIPYLQGEPLSDEKGEPQSVKQGESGSDGASLDSVFIHRATPENISANSTFLDLPLGNDDPDAILYVTQNWNPGGGSGTYNNHPIGVWYEPSSQRWAIFNQDQEPMPEGAAFNVAVLREPTEAK
jgi:hypothetical protein